MQTQDAPAEIMFKLWPWLEANQKRIVIGAVALVAGALIIYFFNEQSAAKEKSAGQALTTLLSTSPGSTSPAALATALAQLADKYSGTVAADRARLKAGETLYAAGSFDQAQAQFEKLLAGRSSGPLVNIARLGLGASYEAQGKLDQAAKPYRDIMAGGDSPVAVTAKFSLARTLEAQGKLNEALNYFSEVARSPLAGSLITEANLHAAEIKIELAATNKPAVK
jgi:predicted negative regulator of RcsB-dependent stress response